MKKITVKYNIKFIEKVTASNEKYYNQKIKISDNCTLFDLLKKLEKKYALGMDYTFLITNLERVLWGKYNLKMLEDDRNEFDYYKMKLSKLNRYGNITKNKLKIIVTGGTGGEVGRIKKLYSFSTWTKKIFIETHHIYIVNTQER